MSTSLPATPVRLSDRAYSSIRRLIIACHLRPGSAISEPDLSARLRQNRAGVRAALLRLAQEGLVRPVPRRGYLVSPLTFQDAQDVFGMRLLLEPPAAAAAVGCIPEEEFRTVQDAFRTGYERGDARSTAAFLRANRQFRVLIAGASGNRRLAEVVAQLVDESERYLWLSLQPENRGPEFLEGCRALSAAILGGNQERAASLSRGQIELARDRVLQALLRHPDVGDAALEKIA